MYSYAGSSKSADMPRYKLYHSYLSLERFYIGALISALNTKP